ncbi:Long-chain-fatty-acid--CoA ligase [Nocardia farcinica]|uniref:fatty acid CoA ligase family protein n=1 Tax=Nocardia farcinica TaxID=37329 RepID=UPI000BF65ABC|nr:fatty acid CoA ligase family protein [Nocardia farcinica]PFX03679.1 Long-chain-fatty-acid--CoA ligase [Nocardia farcinica]PFX09840.1 Long-chain-fatty-acid--CoA ligase [Nocardia farcinica]
MTVRWWAPVERFREFARADPDRAAVIHPDGIGGDGLPRYRTLTRRELDDWSEAIARRLLDAGVDTGTRTIVLVLPGPELYAILLGLFKIGAVPVVIDPGMGIRRMLRCLRAVDAAAFIGIPRAQVLRVLFRRNFAGVRTVVTVGRRWCWGGFRLAEFGRAPTGAGVLEGAAADPDEPLLIAFTTGSTGPAKAVRLTHGNLTAMLAAVDAERDHVPPDTSLVTLPLVGVLDLLLGARCVLPPLIPSRVGSTDPAHVVDAITRFGVRTMFASPAVLVPLLRHLRAHPAALPTLRSIYSGGAPVPAWCIAGLRDVLAEDVLVYAGYGATEALPISTVESRELLGGLVIRAHRGEGTCLGRPSPGVQVRIVAVTDEPISTWAEAEALAPRLADTDGIGEIVVSGAHVSTGYHWPAEADRVGKIADDGRVWHRTGDLGRLDEQGRIWFCGRKSQRVRTAAGTLCTVQVEQVFNAVPGVARTALVGVGAPGAQRPVLCVETEPGADRLAVELRLRTRGAEFALTESIDDFLFHPGFPVDIRHNAKIGREQLARWAAGRSTAGPARLREVIRR